MNRLKYFILAVVALAMFSSCDDKLDVSNPNVQSTGDFWNEEAHLAEGLIAVYNRLVTDGCYARMTPSLNDVRGDDVWSESPWTIYPLTGDFTVQSSYDVLEWMWREWYIMVFRANQVLEAAPGIEFESADYKNRIVGQTYFLRAFTYFNLTESYEKIPLITTVPTKEDDYYPTSTDRETVLNFIEADLKMAIDLLPKNYNSISGPDKGELGRATKGAAQGLLGRLYMIRHKWAEAEAVLKNLIESNEYSLVANYGDNFTDLNENNSESIFEIQFGNYGTEANWWNLSTTDWRQASCIGYNYGLTAFTAWGDMKPTAWLYNKFKEEAAKDGGLDPRLYWTLVSYEAQYDTTTDGRTNEIFGTQPYVDGTLPVDGIYLAKYTYARMAGHTQESDGVMLNSVINYRYMRYADVLLLYAETLCELGRAGDALPFVNQVRARAKMPDIASGLSAPDLLEKIYNERVLELSVEGIRHFDIKRWGWFYDDARLAELQSHDDEFVTWTAGKEYLPIPSGEMDDNPNLLPNIANTNE